MKEPIELDIYPEENKCPLCGDVDIEYSLGIIDESGVTYHCECHSCGAKYDECYDLVFAGNWNIYDKTGQKYEDKQT